LIIAFVLIVGAGYFFQLRSNSDKAPYKISANVAAEMMKESANVIVVDVRTPEEYQQGHIENAKLLPLSELEEKASAVIISVRTHMVVERTFTGIALTS